MKRTSLLATVLLTLGLVFLTTGCSTFSNASTAPKHTPTYALIATVSGGQAPTDAQWSTMQQKFAALLEARGLVLVTDPSQADKLIQVLFVPDLADPATGISYVVSIRNNSGNLLASSARASAASYASNAGFSSFGGQPQYYGYYADYTDYSGSSSSSSGSPSTTPPAHTGNHHVSRPVDCPPETPRPPSDYAGNHPSHSNPGDGNGNHWWNPRPSSDSGSSGGYSSSSSYSSNSSRSSSDFVGPTTSYSSSSSSASYSAPTMSFPSSSSSSSSYSPPPSSPSSSSESTSSHSVPQAEKPL